MRFPSLVAGSLAASLTLASTSPGLAQAQPAPTFETAIDLVSVTAVVRDERGRSVRNLTRDDFEVYEHGQPRPIVDFKVSDQGPVSLAILMDASGSMRVGAQLEASRHAVEHVLSWVQPRPTS